MSNFWNNLFRVERDRSGNVFYSFSGVDGFANGTKYLDYSLTNPVLLTIIALRSKLFSQMKITHVNQSGTEVQSSEVLKLLKSPNYFQSQEDFLYQLMWFMSATGNCYTYQLKTTGNIPKAIYNLVPSEIDLNGTEKVNKFIITDKDFKTLGEKEIIYKLDGASYKLKLSNIIPFYDLANGMVKNSFMQSESRLKGLVKTLQNIDENIKSKNVNLKMTQKYLVSNKSTGNEAQIQQDDRNDISKKLGSQSIMITNAAIDAKHLVSDMKRLYLDEQFSNDALTCLLAFEMSKDVLNYFSNGASTYDNKNIGLIQYIQNSIQTDANMFVNSLSQQFGLFENGEMLKASFDHLPIMAQVMKDKIDTFKAFQETLKLSIENNVVSPGEAKQMTNDFRLKIGL
jgi:hypothetical protein